jgi:hypothetical protein
MRTSTEYDALLDSRGISLAQMGVREIGLRREDALLAVEFLRDAEIPILGGDVWYCRDGKFELTYENWYAEPNPIEDERAYAHRSCKIAEQYVRAFPKLAEVEPLFVLVIRRLQGVRAEEG